MEKGGIIDWHCKYGGWKRRKKRCLVLVVVVVVLVLRGVNCGAAVEDEEEEDSVNVISLENLDALLRLRMVTDIFINETGFEGERARRWTGRHGVPPQAEAQVEPLCDRAECNCEIFAKKFFNVTCAFQSNEVVELTRGSLPTNLYSLHISGAKQLRVLHRAFAAHPAFGEATFSNLDSLHVQREAFLNVSSSIFQLLIQDCLEVSLEEQCYHNPRGPLDVTIEGCESVRLQSHVFSRFVQLQIANVPSLIVVENTFKSLSSVLTDEDKRPATNITFQNVSIETVPNATFALSARVIFFIDCDIGTISSEAFNAIEYSTIQIHNTRVGRLESKAFGANTLVHEMELISSKVGYIAPQVLTVVSNLTIHNCSVGEVTSGAFNLKAAEVVLSSNVISNMRRHSFRITAWNRVIIDGNKFERLEPDSIQLPFQEVPKIESYDFAFTNNIVLTPTTDTLAFLPAENGVKVTVANNKFQNLCHCHLPTWVAGLSVARSQELYETSFCVVNELLARCFNLEEGFMKMTNFTDGLCNDINKLVCEENRRTYHNEIFSEIDYEATEKRVLSVIFLGVVSSVTIMLIILSVIWIRQKGVCATPSSPCSIFSRLFAGSNLVTTASISRINIHEYAEIQNQLNQTVHGQTILIGEEPTDEDELIPCEDKATQTLPEELTQELLQTLREKLNDPENYTEARDMIEHLYDLIKVEESCNNNNPSPRTSFAFEEEEETSGNLYDVIQPRKQTLHFAKSKRRCRGDLVSTGTRAPSPDKLQPPSYTTVRIPPPISEYLEPKDRRSHEYCELPLGDLVMPDVLPAAQGKEGGKMANRPLPERPSASTPPSQPGTSNA